VRCEQAFIKANINLLAHLRKCKICRNMLREVNDENIMQMTDRLAVSYELPLRFAVCGPLRSYKPYLRQKTNIAGVPRIVDIADI